MKNLSTMLLISISILLSSCQPGIPEPPETLEVLPVYKMDDKGQEQVSHFYGRWLRSQQKVTMTIPQAHEAVLVCTDLESENANRKYLKELEELAKLRCK